MTTYLLDTTVLIAHLRGDEEIRIWMLEELAAGHRLATSCVSIAEVERGTRPKERRAVRSLLARLGTLDTTREAALRAGAYLDRLARGGKTLSVADALVAGTARAHGATLVTDNTADFPMRDIRVQGHPS